MFKKELLDEGTEWNTHKKIIDTTAKCGDISKAIPSNFPYFHVDFGGKGGFAHVIENELKFQSYLGYEIVRNFVERDELHNENCALIKIEEKCAHINELKSIY